MTDKNNKSGSEFRRLIINEIMTLIAAKMSDKDMQAVASYMAGLY